MARSIRIQMAGGFPCDGAWQQERAGAPERRSPELAQAARLVEEGLRPAGLGPSAAEIKDLPGSEPRKVALARLVWENTTVSQAWIAERLGMGSAANVSQQLRMDTRTRPHRTLPAPLREFLKRVKNG